MDTSAQQKLMQLARLLARVQEAGLPQARMGQRYLPPPQSPPIAANGSAGSGPGGPAAGPGLPPYEPPGSQFDRYRPPFSPQPVPPVPPPAQTPTIPAMPPPVPVQMPPGTLQMPVQGNPGWGGVEPPPGAPPPYDPNLDPRYLPEMWGGRYNNWQFPR